MFVEPLIAADAATNFLSDLEPEHRFVLLIVTIGCLTALLIVLGSVFLSFWHAARQKQIEADLKRDMLDRGMAPEEIERVIQAKPKDAIERWMSMGPWSKK